MTALECFMAGNLTTMAEQRGAPALGLSQDYEGESVVSNPVAADRSITADTQKLFVMSVFLIAPPICQRLGLLKWSSHDLASTLGAYNARNCGSLPDSDAAGFP